MTLRMQVCHNPEMTVPALALPQPQPPSPTSNADPCTSAFLLDIVERDARLAVRVALLPRTAAGDAAVVTLAEVRWLPPR
jgi:hypothetical protein